MRVCDYLHVHDKTLRTMAEELEMDYKYMSLICQGRARPAKRTMKAILDYCQGFVSEYEIINQKSLTRRIDVENRVAIL